MNLNLLVSFNRGVKIQSVGKIHFLEEACEMRDSEPFFLSALPFGFFHYCGDSSFRRRDESPQASILGEKQGLLNMD